MCRMSTNRVDGNVQVRHDVDSRSPLLIKSLPKSSSLSTQISLLLQDWWLWEISSAFVAILATAVIVIILALYDGSSLPDWPSMFTVRQSSDEFPV